jgi:RimK family alpha-L-glutamate ligase
MKILIVGLTKGRYQFDRLAKEGKKKGLKIVGCRASSLVMKTSSSEFKVYANGVDLEEYPLIYFCSLKEYRSDWAVAASYLHSKGVVVVNDFLFSHTSSYLQSYAYLMQFQAEIGFPTSLVFSGKNSVESQLDLFSFPMIIKKGTSKRGMGVFKVENKEAAVLRIKKLSRTTNTIVLREFIPNDGDYRVFTVGYKAVAAIRRIPAEGEFRSNISQGGIGERIDESLFKKIAVVAEKVSRLLSIEIGGVDIIIDNNTGEIYVLEINIGPQIRGIETFSEVNVASKIVDYFILKLATIL